MRAAPILAIAASILAMAGAARAAPSVSIEDAAARVVVIPEARQDVQVTITRTNRDMPLYVSREGDRTIVSGGREGHRRWLGFWFGGWGWGPWCSGRDGGVRIHLRHRRWTDLQNLPEVVVRAPMDARVSASGAVFGSVGRSDSLTLSNAGCGDWTVANVKGALEVNDAGSGDVRAGAVGALTVHSAGSGDVSARSAVGPVEIRISGSSDASIGQVNGSLDVAISGSGDVRVAGGDVSTMIVRISGSGGVDFGGSAHDVDAAISGSGNVRVGKALGPVRQHVSGSGNVEIGG